jgi:acyl-CoA synthetase
VGGYDGALYILRTRDGAILWTFRTGDQIKASPALDPTSGYVWCPSHDPRPYCPDIYARTCVHSFDCPSPVYSSPAIDDTRRYSNPSPPTLAHAQPITHLVVCT